MKELLASWDRLCVSSAVLRFVDINLRGIGQVMLQDNPLSGALFLAAIVWGSHAAGAPQIAIGGIVALLVATLTVRWVRADEKSLAEGLVIVNYNRLPSLRESLDAGANSSALPILTISSLVGFGAVVAALPAFATVRDAVLSIPGRHWSRSPSP